jgi:HSP20 family protein
MANKSWFPNVGNDGNRGLDAFRGMRTQLDSFFEDWFGRSTGGMLAPRVDMSETDKEVVLAFELPGVDEKDIDVSLAGDQLTVKGEKRSEHENRKDESGSTVHRVERSYGAFQRTMTVPYRIDPEQVSAQFKDGVLKVTLPKPADAVASTQGRRIEVRRTV